MSSKKGNLFEEDVRIHEKKLESLFKDVDYLIRMKEMDEAIKIQRKEGLITFIWTFLFLKRFIW